MSAPSHETRGSIAGKQCRMCREWKPLLHYSIDASKPDGLSASCRPCDCARTSARVHRLTVERHDHNIGEHHVARWARRSSMHHLAEHEA